MRNNWLNRLLWMLIFIQGVAAIVAMRPWMTNDSVVYLELAHSLTEGRYGNHTSAGFQTDVLRPPGYPIILWIWLYVLKLPIAALISSQVALCLASVRLIERFLVQREIDPTVFLLCAVAYPFTAIYGASVMGEAWATLALTYIAVNLARPMHTQFLLVAMGAVAAGAALIRADLLLLPLLIGAVVAATRFRSGFVFATVGSLLPVLAAALVLSPYAAWNYQKFGKAFPAPNAAAVGNSLYLATWQSKLPLRDLNSMYDGKANDQARVSGLVGEVATINRSFGADPALAPFNPVVYPTRKQRIDSSRAFGNAAMQRIRNDPIDYVRHVVMNVWTLWNTGEYPAGIPAIVIFVLSVVSAIMWAAGMVGASIAFVRHRFSGFGIAALVMVYPMVVHLPLHTEARYTAAARPLLLMFAALLLSTLFAWFHRPNSRHRHAHNRLRSGSGASR